MQVQRQSRDASDRLCVWFQASLYRLPAAVPCQAGGVRDALRDRSVGPREYRYSPHRNVSFMQVTEWSVVRTGAAVAARRGQHLRRPPRDVSSTRAILTTPCSSKMCLTRCCTFPRSISETETACERRFPSNWSLFDLLPDPVNAGGHIGRSMIMRKYTTSNTNWPIYSIGIAIMH